MTATSLVSRLDSESASKGFSLRSDPQLTKKTLSSSTLNKITDEDLKFHNWYRFVLSFPPHLVHDYLVNKFNLSKGAIVLDPFCGTGTTITEAQLNGFIGIGIEANDVAYLASLTKVNWSVDSKELLEKSAQVDAEYRKKFARETEYRSLSEAQIKLTLTNSICALPLHKALILIECCNEIKCSKSIKNIFDLAIAKTLVFTASNLHFGPEVGVRGRKGDAQVLEAWLQNVKSMSADLASQEKTGLVQSTVIHGDARSMGSYLKAKSIDAVFTSPPYPNEKDYTRTTRLESVLLGYITSREDLQKVKRTLLRSNTRGVYKGDDDDLWVAENTNVNAIADEIERRRIELNKQSGFEKLYARVTRLYFGGMARHLAELRPFLKTGAMLGYVVGDQASYLQVMIRTGSLLSEIAEGLGYEVVGIDLFRTRISTVTKAYMREEVLILKWLG